MQTHRSRRCRASGDEPGPFTSLHPITIEGLAPGTNTIEFVVRELIPGTPMGLIVDWVSSEPPERFMDEAQEYDAESGMHYSNVPASRYRINGVWTTQDPLQFGTNWYLQDLNSGYDQRDTSGGAPFNTGNGISGFLNSTIGTNFQSFRGASASYGGSSNNAYSAPKPNFDVAMRFAVGASDAMREIASSEKDVAYFESGMDTLRGRQDLNAVSTADDYARRLRYSQQQLLRGQRRLAGFQEGFERAGGDQFQYSSTTSGMVDGTCR